MNFKPILIVSGEPNNIFLELFFKSLKRIKIRSPLVLIASKKLVELQMKKLKFKKNIKVIDKKDLKKNNLNNESINIIDVNYNPKKAFSKISTKSNLYIKNSFTELLKF